MLLQIGTTLTPPFFLLFQLLLPYRHNGDKHSLITSELSLGVHVKKIFSSTNSHVLNSLRAHLSYAHIARTTSQTITKLVIAMKQENIKTFDGFDAAYA